MRLTVTLLAAAITMGQTAAGPDPPTRPIGTMTDLMVKVIFPTSEAVFYIQRDGAPKTDAQWEDMQAKALTLAESANLLMLPGRVRDDKWIEDSKLLLEAGAAAYKAARAKDVAALIEVNDALNTACVTCHVDYRPEFRRYRR
jgi:cytochrome c556